jgi:hypothetical protein
LLLLSLLLNLLRELQPQDLRKPRKNLKKNPQRKVKEKRKRLQKDPH